MHRTLSYTKRIWKQWLFWTLSFISDFSGVTVGGTVRGDQSRKSTEVVYVTIHNEERSRYHTGGNEDWRLISVIIFVYSSSTSLFDMYRYMYDVDGVIFNQKITEKNQKTYYFWIINKTSVIIWNFYIIYPESSKTKYSVWKPCWLCVGWSASIITGRTPGQLDIYLCSLLPDWHLIRYLPFLIWYEPG